jgi:hypothetical protein
MDRVSLAHTSPSPAKKQKQINVPFSHAPSGLFYSWYNWFIRLDGHKIHPSTVLKKVREGCCNYVISSCVAITPGPRVVSRGPCKHSEDVERVNTI